ARLQSTLEEVQRHHQTREGQLALEVAAHLEALGNATVELGTLREAEEKREREQGKREKREAAAREKLEGELKEARSTLDLLSRSSEKKIAELGAEIESAHAEVARLSEDLSGIRTAGAEQAEVLSGEITALTSV